MAQAEHPEVTEASTLRRDGLGQWIAFWCLCGGALAVVLATHGAGGVAATWTGIYVGWAAMVVAMMAPTAVPMLRTYADVQHARSGRSTGAGFWAFLGGYLVVWVAASAAFATAQVALRSVTAGAFSPLLLAALLAIAGGYQLTSFKQACAHHCRSPLLFLLAHWRDGTAGAVALGLRHGVDCVACCWALMLLALAGGAGQPFLMAAVMVVAAVEKLPVVGVRVTRPLGLALLGGAVGCGLFGVL